METTDLTITILKEIRDDARRHSQEIKERFEHVDERFERADQRSEVIETTLRDLAQQMVMLSRGIKTALEVRSATDARFEDHERRLAALESASE